jgi:hypothetical protein
MPQIDLSDEQIQELSTALTTLLGNLSYEIADTDRKEFRDQLKRRRDVLKSVSELLERTDASQ